MTPAINAAKKSQIPYTIHKYKHDSSCEAYGAEAAEKLGVPEERVFKTLIVELDNNEHAVGIIPVSSMLNMKRMAKSSGSKKASMANAADVTRFTGYVLGGVSPLGQKKPLKTIIDSSAENHETIFVSAGRRGIEIELSPKDLRALTNGAFSEISQ
jgi:Cys-tRNA(Pro)/Cys-tRNA(Cys) deacylase